MSPKTPRILDGLGSSRDPDAELDLDREYRRPTGERDLDLVGDRRRRRAGEGDLDRVIEYFWKKIEHLNAINITFYIITRQTLLLKIQVIKFTDGCREHRKERRASGYG